MKARDLVEPVPTVTADDQVAVAVRVMGQAHLPGLIVVDEQRKPRTVLPGSQGCLGSPCPGSTRRTPCWPGRSTR